MKPFNKKSVLCSLFAMCAVCMPVHAQQDDPFGGEGEDEPKLTKEELLELNRPAVIRVQLEFIEIKTADMIDLLYGEKRIADDTNLRVEMQKWLKNGKAKMFETSIVNCQPGEIARVESVEELIYATEYEPGELPSSVTLKTTEKAKATENGKKGENTDSAEVKVPELATPPNSTAFETRNVGTTIELEPTLSADHKIVNIKLSPEIVYHVGYESWLDWKDKRADMQVKMPIFYTLRFDTRVTVKRGTYQFVAAMSPKDDKGKPDPSKKLLVFVKADVLTVK